MYLMCVVLLFCSQAVNFVLSHFQSHSIPENFKTNQGVVHGKDGTLFPLRRQLFDWLLPVPDKSLGRFTAEVTEDGNFKLDASSRYRDFLFLVSNRVYQYMLLHYVMKGFIV